MGFNLIMVIAVSFVPLIMIIFGNMFLKLHRKSRIGLSDTGRSFR
ncbi:hypothetical protein C7381_10290 [Ezakiella coagulans]|uniref:Uncharacterized protein n=1 Tax=Ezakiella coagulans TaxID=46507 RepID=A0A2U1E5J9_9FIRM|nr:hypothetical protein [Ezakiella coagulans]PVY95201.1 hypothetical protein C7381_10290 [Ezakiella coagulans]